MPNPAYENHSGQLRNGLPYGPCSVTILNPQRKTQVLARHEDITDADAVELVAIYRALGYADTSICWLREEAAASAQIIKLRSPCCQSDILNLGPYCERLLGGLCGSAL
jgi:hypothetical protein